MTENDFSISQQPVHASEVRRRENPFRFARTTKTQECFSLKVGVGRNLFSWCHKSQIIFVLFLLPYTHIYQIQTSQFRRILKKVIRVVRKKRTPQQTYTFVIFPQRAAVFSPHHAEAGAVLVHAYRGKKPNHSKTECLIFFLRSMIFKQFPNEV